MIEANSTYRGWFVGGNQTGEWSNRGSSPHVKGRGALGSFFATLEGTLKMGQSVGGVAAGAAVGGSSWVWDGRNRCSRD
jgi:hypothetical protein